MIPRDFRVSRDYGMIVGKRMFTLGGVDIKKKKLILATSSSCPPIVVVSVSMRGKVSGLIVTRNGYGRVVIIYAFIAGQNIVIRISNLR